MGDYFSSAERMAAEAAAAERKWLASLSPRDRAALAGGRKVAREDLGEEEDAASRAVLVRDVAAEVDSLADDLQERFGLSPWQAAAVVGWHEERLSREVEREKGVQLGRVVGLLIKPAHDLRVVVYGLLFASGLGALNGMRSQREAADMLGLERATVSHWARRWQELLELPDGVFGKKRASRERMSAARLRYVAGKRRGGAAVG